MPNPQLRYGLVYMNVSAGQGPDLSNMKTINKAKKKEFGLCKSA